MLKIIAWKLWQTFSSRKTTNPQGGASLQHGGWGSSDGAHRKHNEETGGNVEPLIHQEKRNNVQF